MTGILLMCRSMTHAQKIIRALRNGGISAEIVRPDIKLTKQSCTNAVRISQGYLPEAMEILQKSASLPTKIILAEQNGNYRELVF